MKTELNKKLKSGLSKLYHIPAKLKVMKKHELKFREKNKDELKLTSLIVLKRTDLIDGKKFDEILDEASKEHIKAVLAHVWIWVIALIVLGIQAAKIILK